MHKKIGSWLLCLLLLFPVVAQANTGELPFDVGNNIVLLMEPETGTVLFSQNETKQVPIASVTKIMTLLIAFDEIEKGNIGLEDKVTISKNAADTPGSQAFLDAGAQYPVSDLLKTIIISSANDSSVALAEYIAGNELTFVEMMNQRAHDMLMNDTLFQTCTGLPTPQQYSTAADVAIMARALIDEPLYFTWSTIWMDTLTHPSGRQTELTNTNRLVRFYSGADGLKTGYSNEAGHCLTATATRGDMRLIAVLLGFAESKSRFATAQKLLDYGFDSYELTTVVKEGELVKKDVPVRGGTQNKTDLVSAGTIRVLRKKGAEPDYVLTQNLPDAIDAPVAQGQSVGQTSVVLPNGEVLSTDVVCTQEIGSGFWGMIGKILTYWH